MNVKLFGLVAAVAVGLSACNTSGEDVPTMEQLTAQLKAKYGQVRQVSFNKQGDYTVATFSIDTVQSQAWFAGTAQRWALTEIDLPFAQLPTAVRTAFDTSPYGSWRVDDVDRIDREGVAVMYIIEVEQGNEEVELYYSEDGTLIKLRTQVANTPVPPANSALHDHLLPTGLQAVYSYLKTHYPKATVLEIDDEDGRIEVDILDGNVHRELLFGRDGRWITTKIDDGYSDAYDYTSTPASIRTLIEQYIAKHYAGAILTDFDHERSHYEVEIRRNGVELDLIFDLEGRFLREKSDAPGLTEAILTTIQQYIARNYPGAIIKDVERDDDTSLFEVEISHNGHERDLMFDANGNFVREDRD